jgi:hypothetical protein
MSGQGLLLGVVRSSAPVGEGDQSSTTDRRRTFAVFAGESRGTRGFVRRIGDAGCGALVATFLGGPGVTARRTSGHPFEPVPKWYRHEPEQTVQG